MRTPRSFPLSTRQKRKTGKKAKPSFFSHFREEPAEGKTCAPSRARSSILASKRPRIMPCEEDSSLASRFVNLIRCFPSEYRSVERPSPASVGGSARTGCLCAFTGWPSLCVPPVIFQSPGCMKLPPLEIQWRQLHRAGTYKNRWGNI